MKRANAIIANIIRINNSSLLETSAIIAQLMDKKNSNAEIKPLSIILF